MHCKNLLVRTAATVLGSAALLTLPVTSASAMARDPEPRPASPATSEVAPSADDSARKKETCTDWIFNGWGNCDDFATKCKGKVTDLGYDPWFISWSVSCEER